MPTRRKHWRELVEHRGDCWVWHGARNGQHGQYSVTTAGSRSRVPAHNAAWLETGHPAIPANQHLVPTCGDYLCINPDHRRLATRHEIRCAPREVREREFWSRVDRRGPDECWEWAGPHPEGRYAYFDFLGEHVGAHRLAYRLTKGDPAGMVVRHSCDNPPCCNPGHLLVGTPKDNTADMFNRGRQHRRDGIYHSRALFTEDQVRAIRAAYDQGAVQRHLAHQYGVGVMVINRLVRRLSYINVA